MEEDKKRSILHRPILEVPKNYYSDGELLSDDLTREPELIDKSQENLIQKAENLKKSLLFVPGAIRPATESILNLVHFLLILVESDDNGDEDDNAYEIITPEKPPPIVPSPESPSGDIDLDDIFKDGHKPITIIKETVSDSVKIERFYSRSTLDISAYYVDKLSQILADYHANLFIQPEIEKVLDETYKDPLIDYSDKIAHSILQTLLKSQQDKISKMRLYQKLYNEKEGITILKSLEYSKLTLLKATGNAPKNPRLYYKHIQTIEAEKRKLDKKMFEYYRYLDSSLEALNMCLNMQITEAIAKVELHEINKTNKEIIEKENST